MILRHAVYPCGDTEVDLWALDTFGRGISAAEFPGMAFTDAGPWEAQLECGLKLTEFGWFNLLNIYSLGF